MRKNSHCFSCDMKTGNQITWYMSRPMTKQDWNEILTYCNYNAMNLLENVIMGSMLISLPNDTCLAGYVYPIVTPRVHAISLPSDCPLDFSILLLFLFIQTQLLYSTVKTCHKGCIQIFCCFQMNIVYWWWIHIVYTWEVITIWIHLINQSNQSKHQRLKNKSLSLFNI